MAWKYRQDETFSPGGASDDRIAWDGAGRSAKGLPLRAPKTASGSHCGERIRTPGDIAQQCL